MTKAKAPKAPKAPAETTTPDRCPELSPAALTPRNAWPCELAGGHAGRHYNRNAGVWG